MKRKILLGLAAAFFSSLASAGTDSWTPVGPDLASVGALAVSAGGDLWAGAMPAGLFRSAEKTRWNRAGSFGAQALAADPRDAGRIWAGGPDGIHRTFDGGNTWTLTRLPAQLRGGQIAQLVVAPAAPDRLYAFQGAPYRSLDGGIHWELIGQNQLPIPTVFALAVDARDPDLVYAASFDALFRSRDGGLTWTQLPGFRNVRALAAPPTQSGTLLAGTVEQGIWKSTDAGASWRQTRQRLENTAVRTTRLAFDPVRDDRLWAFGGSAVFESTDRGASWRPWRHGLEALEVLDLAPGAPGTLFAAGFQDARPAVFRSRDDGAAWTPLAGPFLQGGAGFFSSVAVHPARPATVFAAGSTGLFRSRNGGDRWLRFGAGLPAEVALLRIPPSGGSTMFALSPENDRHWIFRSTDLGAHWVRLAGPQVNTSFLQIADLVIDPRRASTLYAATSHGAFASDDGGDRWHPLDPGGALFLPVLALAVDPRDPRQLYAGSSEGGLFRLTRSDR